MRSNDRKRGAAAGAAQKKNHLMASSRLVRMGSFLWCHEAAAAVSPSAAMETCSSRLSTSRRRSFHRGWFAVEVPSHKPRRHLTWLPQSLPGPSTVAQPAVNLHILLAASPPEVRRHFRTQRLGPVCVASWRRTRAPRRSEAENNSVNILN